jgi:hypothetical protein
MPLEILEAGRQRRPLVDFQLRTLGLALAVGALSWTIIGLAAVGAYALAAGRVP